MRILFINGSAVGSSGAIATSLITQLVDQGHTVDFVIPKKEGSFNYNLVSLYELCPNRLKNRWLSLETKLLGNNGFCNTKSTLRMLSSIQKPDLIHIHSIHSYFINIEPVLEYAKRESIPVIWTMHDMWLLTGRCATAEKGRCPKLSTGCVRCPNKKIYPRSLLFDFAKKYWQKKRSLLKSLEKITIVCPSNWLASITKNELPNIKVIVINNGIDQQAFSPRIDLATTNRVGCAAANWSIDKGASLLEPIAKSLQNRGIRLSVVGIKGSEFESALFESLPKINSKADMANFYRGIDVFFNPTLTDNFPTVNLEALSCGTPVVCTNVGGARESLREGVNGFSFNVDEALDSIVDKILLAQSLSRQNAFDSSKPYSKEEMSRRYLELYKKALNQ